MSDHPGQTTEPNRAPVEWDNPGTQAANRHWITIHPRLRHDHLLGKGWSIKASGTAELNPRTLRFCASSRHGVRWFRAVQHYGSEFIEITEQQGIGGPDIFCDAENEPEIARYVHKAVDVQWPMGARGVTRRGVQ